VLLLSLETELTRRVAREMAPSPAFRGDSDWLGAALRRLDRFLQRWMGIAEFCSDDRCVLRIGLATAARDVILADGTQVRKGDPIGELHLWNEHLPRLPKTGSGLAWALEVRRRFDFSFARLSHHIETDRRFRTVAAFRGGMSFANRVNRAAKLDRVMNWHGIEIVPTAPSAFAALHEFGNALFTLFLVRAFNPGGSFGPPSLRRRQHELWLSRRVLRARYGQPTPDNARDAATQAAAKPMGAA
jgi:hypothetical protein